MSVREFKPAKKYKYDINVNLSAGLILTAAKRIFIDSYGTKPATYSLF